MKFDKSMIDVAEEALKEEGSALPFHELFQKVAERLEMSEGDKAERIGRFYSDLTIDARFVGLPDNTWDLRVRHTFEKSRLDLKNAYSDEPLAESEIDPDDKRDEEEYDAAMQGKTISHESEDGTEEGERRPDEDIASLVG